VDRKKRRGIFAISFFRIDFIVLSIVTLMAIMFVGGVVPKMEPTPSETGQEYIPVPGSGTGGGKSSLQLNPIQFKKCSGTVTIDFLLDRSGSMGNLTPSGKSKISRLKEAVLELTNKLSDTSIVGIQSFSSTKTGTNSYTNNLTNDVPVSFYKDIKTLIPVKVNSMQANGSTPTHDALAYSYGVLQTALPLFKDRKFSFVFVSDGAPVPENQDPRLFTPNPANEIKALGVNVFSLAIYDSNQSKAPKLAELLKNVASKPGNYYEAQNADQVSSLLQQILTKLCDEPAVK